MLTLAVLSRLFLIIVIVEFSLEYLIIFTGEIEEFPEKRINAPITNTKIIEPHTTYFFSIHFHNKITYKSFHFLKEIRSFYYNKIYKYCNHFSFMYKKYLIIASKKDKAGINITTALSQFRKNPFLGAIQRGPLAERDAGIVKNSPNVPIFDFYLVEGETIFDESLDKERINRYDFVIFASKHESEKGGKTLSVHAPGNWRTAQMGGVSGKICRASALFQKQLFINLNKKTKEHLLKDYQVTLECTHHGPFIDKPCVYIEIGATDTEWSDRRAAFVVAQTIKDTINEFKTNPYNEIAIGIGGPHYCPNFNELQLKSNYAFAHMIPEYSLPISLEMIQEAIDKTEEELDLVIFDWKGLKNKDERERIIKLLDKNYIRYKRTSEAKKEY